MKTSNVNMLSGSITKGLIALTIPIMIMNVMQSLFNITDMTVLRIFADDRAVGAVGACGMLITLCTSLFIGTSVGVNVIVARRLGAGNGGRAGKAVMTAILFAIFSGMILMGIGVTFAETFLRMTNCPESLLPQAVQYFKIYFYGVPILLLYNFSASVLRAIGDTKNPMYFLVIGGIIKILFTLFFVTAFDMGVAGVAFATILSNGIVCILSMYTIVKGQNVIFLHFNQIKMDMTELKEMLFIGIPAGFQSALYSLANVVITTVVNSFGADATTGIAIANQFDGILYQISYAPSLAVTPYIAQNIGAGNIKRVKQTLRRAICITVAFGASFGALSAIFSEQLSSIMSSTPAVIAFSKQKMIIISSTYFICGINDVMGGMLRGMGKPIVPTVSTLVFMCLLRFLWVYAIFPLCPNLTFLYTVWPVGWILSIITLLIVYFPAISKLQKESLRLPQNSCEV